MYYKFTKLAKISIVFSMIATTLVIFYHSYNVHLIIKSNKLIFERMASSNVLRETAIDYLQKEGVDLFVGGEFSTLTGIVFSIIALICLYIYSKNNTFFFAITASIFCLLTTFVCGFLMLFVILSGKSEKSVPLGERQFRSPWEKYISKMSKENTSAKHQETGS